MPTMVRALLVTVALLVAAEVAESSVLCARRRSDGTISGGVKIRTACRPNEVALTPEMVGFCCPSTATTTSTSLGCPTTTTLGVPDCQGPAPTCLGYCAGGQACTDTGGQCTCTGPIVCGVGGACGGSCGSGQTCQPFPVPSGCPLTGACLCQ